MADTLLTLRPTYDLNANWFRNPDTAEPNTSWSLLARELVDDTKYLYQWLPASLWFDDMESYSCEVYPDPNFIVSNPAVLISIRAKAVPQNPLLVGISTLRVYYYGLETENFYTDFTLTSSWETYESQIPFDWVTNHIPSIRFQARVNYFVSNLYISQIYFSLLYT